MRTTFIPGLASLALIAAGCNPAPSDGGGGGFSGTNFPLGTFSGTMTLLITCSGGPGGTAQESASFTFEANRLLLDGAEIVNDAVIPDGTVTSLTIQPDRISFSVEYPSGENNYDLRMESGGIRLNYSEQTQNGSRICNSFGATNLN